MIPPKISSGSGPDQIGVYNWSFFDSKEFEDLYQQGVVEQDDAKRKAIFNRMEDLMEDSGGFVFICFEPLCRHSR